MEFCFANVDDFLEEDFIKILDDNRTVCSYKKKEIERLKRAASFLPISQEEKTEPVLLSPSVSKEQNFDFEKEVDYYLTEFRGLEEDEIEESGEEVLPVPENYRYQDILLRMIAEFSRDMKEIHEILLTEQDSICKEDLIEYRKELSDLRHRISFLKDALKKKNSLSLESVKKNQLIFVPTSSGNIRVMEELKSIPDSYYDRFLGLFTSIEDGTFKNIRRFLNNERLKGALEVKDFKVRVVFTRISKDCYAIITAFMKKSDNDYGYRRPIEIKLADYRNIQDELKKKIEEEDFIKMNQDIKEELYCFLGKEDSSLKEKIL